MFGRQEYFNGQTAVNGNVMGRRDQSTMVMMEVR
jgi:hypothetical protein